MAIQRELNDFYTLMKAMISRMAACLVWVGLLAQTPCLVAAPVDELKAAYLLNFARLTAWKPDSFPSMDSPVIFCALIGDSVISAFRSFGDRRVDTRPVRIQGLENINDNKRCHVLYHRDSGTFNVNLLRRRGLLLVGDSHDFLNKGGVISFFVKEGKLRFDISAENADSAGLVLSARLLNLARRRSSQDL